VPLCLIPQNAEAKRVYVISLVFHLKNHYLYPTAPLSAQRFS